MSEDKVQFGSGLLGNKLTVYDNRVEIVAGCFPFRRKRVIPMSSIANVEKHRFLNKVIIHTNDGKKVDYAGSAAKIQQTIIERM